MICPYCQTQAEFISSKDFYGTNYRTNLYVCRPCDARVGTHGRGKTPLGTMANAELRELRKLCHARFDVRWKFGKVSRYIASVFLHVIFTLVRTNIAFNAPLRPITFVH
ncbi:zinc-finger-containing protein [Lysinibacillus sp. NPDC096212]|uniref:zinc-finger-containing protein n=1 Tax=Lysinibacillus sp. NPDC096212 TaxID=3364135 RepID=UPI0037F492DA